MGLAEYAYGGYFKGSDLPPGITATRLIGQVPMCNVSPALQLQADGRLWVESFPQSSNSSPKFP
jgi:hypothetical protein